MTSQPEIRRNILEALYRCHKAEAFCLVKTMALIETLGIEDEQEFLDALQFLHDEEYIKGIFVTYQRQGHFENVRITQKGVDIVNNAPMFEETFPAHGLNKRPAGS